MQLKTHIYCADDAYLCVMSTPTGTMAIKTLKIISIQRRSHKLVLMQYFKI